jgi:hypothetical protein
MITAALRAAGVDPNRAPAPAPAPPPVVNVARTSYTPTFAAVNPSTDTASAQINKLLAENGPYLQRAQSLAQQRANSRGLINSSIGAGAGTAAAIDAAGTIGTADAGIYSQQRLANQDAGNRMELARGDSETQGNLQDARARNDLTAAGYDDLLARGRLGLENQFSLSRSVFDAGVGEARDYRTADLNDRNDARSSDRSFSNSSRLSTQDFGQSRTLNSETDFRREGIADRARTSEQGFATSERLGSQGFQAGENLANRTFQTGERLGGQQFTAGENQANRQFQTGERIASQEFTSGENATNRTFTAEENRLNREAQVAATSKGLTGQIAQNAASEVSRILSDPNIDQENKQGLIDRVWDNARRAQGIADAANGTNFDDIFPGGASNPRVETAQTITPQTQQQIIDQAVNRIVEQRAGNVQQYGIGF